MLRLTVVQLPAVTEVTKIFVCVCVCHYTVLYLFCLFAGVLLLQKLEVKLLLLLLVELLQVLLWINRHILNKENTPAALAALITETRIAV